MFKKMYEQWIFFQKIENLGIFFEKIVFSKN